MRSFLVKIFLYLFLLPLSCLSQNLFIGTHVTETNKGLYCSKLAQDGALMPSTRLLNDYGTSVLVYNKKHKLLYTSGIGINSGQIHCFDLNKNILISTISSQDLRPCYLSLDKEFKYLFVANIKEGSLCSFKLNNAGSIGDLILGGSNSPTLGSMLFL